MNQIRYFIALGETLNFTRAAELCNVTQPALTRAIHALEIELGGELLRRERSLSHLTELGERMLPFMRQCYESAIAAKSLATAVKKGDVAPLSIGLSQTIDADLLSPKLRELSCAFDGLRLRLQRGRKEEILDALKSGEIELAITDQLDEAWDRLDAFDLFEEQFELAFARNHGFAERAALSPADLANEHLICFTQCAAAAEVSRRVEGSESRIHEVVTAADMLALLEANVGVGIVPESVARSEGTRRLPMVDFNMSRRISVYAVAGRRRSHAGGTLLNLLRAADWAPDHVPPQLRRASQ